MLTITTVSKLDLVDRFRFMATALAASGWIFAACEPGTDNRRLADTSSYGTLVAIESPAEGDPIAPNLAISSHGPLLSWLEPTGEGPVRDFALRVARLGDGAFEAPSTIATGPGFFANWADLPAIAEDHQGRLAAHWLRKIGDDTYAYGVGLAGSSDGVVWSDQGWLHDDLSPTEHGFVSYAAAADGVDAFWLDGREMEHQGPMELRTARLPSSTGEPATSTVLDERVCECCATDAAVTANGPIVVYRNRNDQEVRDIWRVRWTGDGWSAPAPVFEDGWAIPGCPVNGPAVAADGTRVVVAWFTAADESPKVKVAVSSDGGNSFGAPMVVDAERPTGRVDVAMRGEEAWVSWLGLGAEGTAVLIRRIELGDTGGRLGPIAEVATTSAERAAGFPRMLALTDRLLLAWVETGHHPRLRVAALVL